MPKLRALFLLLMCVALPAQAGLFSDDEAHKKIQVLQSRVDKLDALGMEDVLKQQSKAILDLQSQIEDLKAELRKLHGQNEELAHGLQEADKREKDFYVDLDTRLRSLESASSVSATNHDPVAETHALELAAGLARKGDHAGAAHAYQDFIAKNANSEQVPNAMYSLANEQLALVDEKNARATLTQLISKYPNTPAAGKARKLLAGAK